MSMIRLEGVSKFYKSVETVSVGMKKVNLSFDLGEFVAVTGESGSGKSTLLNVISGLDGYEEGELYIRGEETSHFTIADWERYRGSNIGFVFQNYNIIDSFTVYQNVVLALEVQGYPKHLRKSRALELIEKVGLISHKNHKASKLSGGQKQRTVIARALAKDCPIIVCDEPTGNLDSQSGAQVLKLLHDISQEKLVIVVTHDYEQVETYATRKIKMHDGEVVEDKSVKKPNIVEKDIKPEYKGMSLFTLIRFTLRSLFSMPKRLIFLVLLQAIAMIVFSLVYTNRISQMREIETRQSSRFVNVTETRLLVERRDGLAITDSEITAFENMKTVEHVHKNGLAFYNSVQLHAYYQNYTPVLQAIFYYSDYSFIGTDAAITLKDSDIIGRKPTAYNEVVVGGNYTSFQLGQTIRVASQSSFQSPSENDFIGKFVVVGIDKKDRGVIYFSEAYLADATISQYTIDRNILEQVSKMADYDFYTNTDQQRQWLNYSESLLGRTLILPGNLPDETEPRSVSFNVDHYFGSGFFQSTTLSITIPNVMVKYDSNLEWMGYFSTLIHQELKTFILAELEFAYKIQNRPVVSLSVLGRNNGIKTVNNINQEVYRAIYPANVPNASAGTFSFMIGLFTGIQVILMALLLYTIVFAVSKNMMKSRKKDFAIFRSIGTNQSSLAKLVIFEQLCIALISSVMMIVALYFLGQYIPPVYKNIQYMEFSDYITLIVAFLLLGLWLGLRFNKKIFKQTVIESIVSAKEE